MPATKATLHLGQGVSRCDQVELVDVEHQIYLFNRRNVAAPGSIAFNLQQDQLQP